MTRHTGIIIFVVCIIGITASLGCRSADALDPPSARVFLRLP